jgi:ABC-2 type transport system permease protein
MEGNGSVKLHEFNWRRFWTIVGKEFIQMRRDRVTFAMMIGIPILQLIIFGYAINSDPKHLPTAVYSADNSVFSRTIVWGLHNSSYFDIVREPKSEAEIQRLLAQGMVQFAVNIPVDFSRKLLRGERPDLLLEADATDPAAIGYAVAAINLLTTTVLNRDLTGPLTKLRGAPPPFNLVVHQHYNPENITQYNIVPGLMGVMLTMTMIIITALAITRERERGTMENLLSTPARPGEVMIGKIVPYITVGYIQVFLILLASKFLFNVPIVGSVPLLLVLTFFFIVANLAVGITFSTIAKNQLQAVQMAFFFFLPSLLLSGYMFPFRGMPGWAQDIGEILPLTHFLRVVRGILLKGNGFAEIAPDLWPIALFLVVMLAIGIKRYRQTLD